MSYAVFKDGDRISRHFQTEGDAWDCANDAGHGRIITAADALVTFSARTTQLQPKKPF